MNPVKPTVEELMKPRIIVENNYPRSPFKHHEIIECPSEQQIQWAKEFTLNFRFLNWWEYRKPEDMPEYLKIYDTIYKISHWEIYLGWLPHEYNPKPDSVFRVRYHFNKGLPATIEDYTTQTPNQ